MFGYLDALYSLLDAALKAVAHDSTDQNAPYSLAAASCRLLYYYTKGCQQQC